MWKIGSMVALLTLAGCATTSTPLKNGKVPPQNVLSIQTQKAQDVLEYVPGGGSPISWQTAYGISVTFSAGEDEFYGNTPCRLYRISFGGNGTEGYACRHTSGTWQGVNRSSMVSQYGNPSRISPSLRTYVRLHPDQKQKQSLGEEAFRSLTKSLSAIAPPSESRGREHRTTEMFSEWNGGR